MTNIAQTFTHGRMEGTRWALEGLSLAHVIVNYDYEGAMTSQNEKDLVRMHFGLNGAYHYQDKLLSKSFQLAGGHNNLLYANGMNMTVKNESLTIETFGIDFHPDTFFQIATRGSESLKRFADQVGARNATILSNHWRPNTYKINQVIQEVIECQYEGPLKDIFLWSKSLELLVLQADLYSKKMPNTFIKNRSDKAKIQEARYIILSELEQPPGIRSLAKRIGLNEYKLKKGFKEQFGITIFGMIQQERLKLAKQYLLDTDKTAQEIAYDLGFSSPQHFNTAFKKAFQVTPKSIRKTP